jgi:hypothetical protein
MRETANFMAAVASAPFVVFADRAPLIADFIAFKTLLFRAVLRIVCRVRFWADLVLAIAKVVVDSPKVSRIKESLLSFPKGLGFSAKHPKRQV